MKDKKKNDEEKGVKRAKDSSLIAAFEKNTSQLNASKRRSAGRFLVSFHRHAALRKRPDNPGGAKKYKNISTLFLIRQILDTFRNKEMCLILQISNLQQLQIFLLFLTLLNLKNNILNFNLKNYLI